MHLTYVYAMLNTRNGYVKLGRSDHPSFREQTLQSEEPEIELLWLALVRPETEQDLHSIYADRRVRGEWFALSDQQIAGAEAYALDRQDELCGYKTSFYEKMLGYCTLFSGKVQ